MSTLTLSRLKEVLEYSPDTGRFHWIVRKAICLTVGKEAGRVGAGGYHYIKLDGRSYLGHRLAWFYTHGVWPSGEIDHINGKRDDNRVANLRDVSPSCNQLNRHKHNFNKLGFPGLYLKRGRFGARVKVDGKFHYLGVYDTREEAYAAYLSARTQWLAMGARLTVVEEIQAMKEAA